MKKTLLQLMLTCIVWHAQHFGGWNSERDALAYFNSLPRTAIDAHMAGAGTQTSTFWMVTWGEECRPTPTPDPRFKPVPTSTPIPVPTKDWKTMPTKYRTPLPKWKPGDPR